MKIKIVLLFTSLFFILNPGLRSKISKDSSGFNSPGEIKKIIKLAGTKNKRFMKLHKLAKSPGGVPIYIVEINPSGKFSKSIPAVFVAANLKGINLISSEAAIFLINKIAAHPEYRAKLRWFILPLGNPDSAKNFFRKPRYMDSRNSGPYNDDMDDAVDEDGFDDLNGDGIITMMRVKDIGGKYIPVKGKEPLMKKADPLKNEKGIYKLYTEGIDNDGDGRYNEDPPGGTDVSINFPHLFKHFTKTGGMWPGSTSEVFSLFKFIFDHKEIAMTVVFGESNFCKVPPKGGRKGSVDYDKIKIPKRIGKFFKVDTDKTYSMKEIMDMVKKVVPSGMEVTESMVASFLGLGAVVNPLKNDLKYYEKISKEFKEFLKKNKLDSKRAEPAAAKDGSFELWSYYHLGLPSFSMDFWTLPEVK